MGALRIQKEKGSIDRPVPIYSSIDWVIDSPHHTTTRPTATPNPPPPTNTTQGMNRNQDNPDAEVHEYGDRRVCKHFLLGCCPHDVFRQTKIDLVGGCVRCWGLGLWLYILPGGGRLLSFLPKHCANLTTHVSTSSNTQNTIQGACEKIHKDELKEQFDAAVDKGERGALAVRGRG